MKERQKIIEDWEKRWNSWEPTGIKCPKCGGELRLVYQRMQEERRLAAEKKSQSKNK